MLGLGGALGLGGRRPFGHANLLLRFGVDAGHLMVGSVMAVPAGLICTKMLWPETEQSKTLGTVTKGGATLPVHRFRFAYLASFLRSYVQVLDLDATAAGGSFETVVFSLGEPTAPKGS